MASLDAKTGVLRITRREVTRFRERPKFVFNLEGKSPEVEWNLMSLMQRGIFPANKLTFWEMDYLRRNMPPVHSSIEFLKARMMSFNFKIRKKKGRHNNLSEKRAERVERILRGPNQFGHTYRQNMMMWFDNLLQFDVGAVEKAVGILGAIDQIGTLDARFLRPNVMNLSAQLNPTEAYLECSLDDPDKILNTYRSDEVMWGNLNPMPKSFYGLSPIEVLHNIIIMSINADKHNIKLVHPNSEKGGGIVWLGDVQPEVRKEFEERYDMFRKADPSRPVFTGGGAEPKFLDFESNKRVEWEKLQARISEICASVYGLNLRDIGIQSERGSAGTAAIDDMITLRSAIIPRMLIVGDLLNVHIVEPAGGEDLQIEFETKKDESLETRTRTGSMAVGRGIITLNEARELIDETLDPFEDEIGNEPFVVAGNQVLKIRDVLSGKMQVIPTENIIDATNKFSRASAKQNSRGGNENWT